jgi:hypothetical protein
LTIWPLAVVLLAPCLGAAETLAAMDFETLDLKALPAGWFASRPEDMAIVDEAGRGKILRITHKGNGWAHLQITLDAAKVRGRTIRISALAKLPGTYQPRPDPKENWAKPRITLTYKDKDGKDQHPGDVAPEPNKPEWQNLARTFTIHVEANDIKVAMRIDLVAAEVFFDNFIIELDPDLSKPPVTGGTTTPATPAAPQSPAAKAPKRTLDDGGLLFGPEIAEALTKAVKPGTANSYAIVGPGLPLRELDGKPPEKWTRAPATKETAGLLAAPRRLLPLLPDYISGNKPEVIFLVGEITTTRKLSLYESLDWEDLARLCLRMGSVPVMVIPPAAPSKEGPITMAEDVRTSMIRAATDANCPAIDLKTLAQVPRLVTQMTTLLDKHVFCRAPLDAPTPAKKKDEEE